MNIYEKLANARLNLQSEGLKKTGSNQRFKYFELKDFLPKVNEIFAELKMCSVVTFDHDFATLTIYNTEKDESIKFTSPMVQRALPSGTEIQNLGAIQTYQRRYLYLTALEIAESDAVDCLDTSAESPVQQSDNIFDPQAEFYAYKSAAENAKSVEELKEHFSLAWKRLKGYEQQQWAKDLYEVRKSDFEQEKS